MAAVHYRGADRERVEPLAVLSLFKETQLSIQVVMDFFCGHFKVQLLRETLHQHVFTGCKE